MEAKKEKSFLMLKVIAIVVIIMTIAYKCVDNELTEDPRDVIVNYLSKPIPDSILVKYDCELVGGDGNWLRYECYESYPSFVIYVEIDTRVVKRIRNKYR